MARPTYSYDPTKIGERGKDRMRFELGDTITEGEGQAAALSDEEYEAILATYPGRWKRAKLALIESIMRRFSYEVDEKVGPLSLSLRQRYLTCHSQLSGFLQLIVEPFDNAVCRTARNTE